MFSESQQNDDVSEASVDISEASYQAKLVEKPKNPNELKHNFNINDKSAKKLLACQLLLDNYFVKDIDPEDPEPPFNMV